MTLLNAVGWQSYRGQVISPTKAMELAISEGYRGTGFVSPNPLVGCTIVDRNHRLLAVGYHARVGGDHAEISALKQLPQGSTLEGCHVYVTLEPCAHQGRTPSCARTLAPLKPASVTYAIEDPNPLVAGKGAEILREAGVQSRTLQEAASMFEDASLLIEDAENLAEVFLHNHRTKTPFIAVKVASSLDGKMAFANGESKWITGEMSREHVQLLRAKYDAVLVGRNTFVVDDPSLNVRHALYPDFVNKAVVIDLCGKTLPALKASKLIQVRKPENVFVVVDSKAPVSNESGVRLIKLDSVREGKIEIPELLAALKSEGIQSVMVEGGAHTIASFFEVKAVQRLHLFTAPMIIGGKHGISWSSHFGPDAMANSLRMRSVHTEQFGADTYTTGRLT